jgi:hypothetical protein
VIVPPRSTAVLGDTAETAPTQRDRHLQCIAGYGRMGWQKRSGFNRRSLVEASPPAVSWSGWAQRSRIFPSTARAGSIPRPCAGPLRPARS